MSEPKENLLATVNLNGTELVIADMDARSVIDGINKRLEAFGENLGELTARVTNLETKYNSLINAKYDAESSALNLTSNNNTPN